MDELVLMTWMNSEFNAILKMPCRLCAWTGAPSGWMTKEGLHPQQSCKACVFHLRPPAVPLSPLSPKHASARMRQAENTRC